MQLGALLKRYFKKNNRSNVRCKHLFDTYSLQFETYIPELFFKRIKVCITTKLTIITTTDAFYCNYFIDCFIFKTT